MGQNIVAGMIAGAAGTTALNIATYIDMAIRGRSASTAPSDLVDSVTKRLNLPLTSQGVDAQDEQKQNRESGLGALLGYMSGLGVGIIYSLIRSRVETVPLPLAALGVGLGAMAASDVPLIASRVSDPRSWGVSGWLSDLIPHLLYGLVTVATYESLIDESDA